ncbi:MAG TPA: 2-dehydropantoate 2-reductase [Ramlibacter sp.]
MKQVLVVGVGAIGGIVAARLAAQAGVTGLDTNGEHAQRISEHGLAVEGVSRHQVRFPCVTQASDLRGRRFDAIVFLTKSKATASVVDALSPLLAHRPLLVTLQNGMGNSEVLAATGLPVARGVTMSAGRYVEPGRVEHLIAGTTWLGPAAGSMDDLRWFAGLLEASGLPCEVIGDPMDAVWSKFVFNCVMNPVGALVGGSNAARYEVPEVRALIDEMAAECQQVVRALGGSFAFDPMAFVHKVRAGEVPRSKHAGSMALDIARGAETEIDELTGWIVAQGRRLGIAVPACRAVTQLVKGLEYAARERHSSKQQETRA